MRGQAMRRIGTITFALPGRDRDPLRHQMRRRRHADDLRARGRRLARSADGAAEALQVHRRGLVGDGLRHLQARRGWTLVRRGQACRALVLVGLVGDPLRGPAAVRRSQAAGDLVRARRRHLVGERRRRLDQGRRKRFRPALPRRKHGSGRAQSRMDTPLFRRWRRRAAHRALGREPARFRRRMGRERMERGGRMVFAVEAEPASRPARRGAQDPRCNLPTRSTRRRRSSAPRNSWATESRQYGIPRRAVSALRLQTLPHLSLKFVGQGFLHPLLRATA